MGASPICHHGRPRSGYHLMSLRKGLVGRSQVPIKQASVSPKLRRLSCSVAPILIHAMEWEWALFSPFPVFLIHGASALGYGAGVRGRAVCLGCTQPRGLQFPGLSPWHLSRAWWGEKAEGYPAQSWAACRLKSELSLLLCFKSELKSGCCRSWALHFRELGLPSELQLFRGLTHNPVTHHSFHFIASLLGLRLSSPSGIWNPISLLTLPNSHPIS